MWTENQERHLDPLSIFFSLTHVKLTSVSAMVVSYVDIRLECVPDHFPAVLYHGE